MAKLTKADAARQLGIARSTLYKLIDQGKVSPTPDGLIDSTELVRVAPLVDVLHERLRTSRTTTLTDAVLQKKTSYGRPQTDDREHSQTDEYGRMQTSTDVVVDLLREQLQVLREELQAARQNAQAAQEREALLLRMLHESQQRYDRLLDVPRPPVVPVEAPPRPPVPPRPRPAFNPKTHTLGSLCARGHDWQGTGQSLRKRSNGRCLACDAELTRQRRHGAHS